MQDPDICVSLEQLIMRLLQGFYDEDEPVTLVNFLIYTIFFYDL